VDPLWHPHEFRRLELRLAYVYQVVEYVPDKRLVMRTADGPFPMETTYEMGANRYGTRMTLGNRGTPSSFSRIVAPSCLRRCGEQNQKDLATARRGEISETPLPAIRL
jgi:hypothetical protein